MSDVYLNHLAYALGGCSQDVEAAGAAGLLLSPAAALRDAGFDKHHYCAPDEDAYGLARQALAASNIDPSIVDCIVYATCLPLNANLCPLSRFEGSGDVKHLMDFPASRLQADHGMENAFVVGLNQQACTGMLGSVRLARNMLAGEPDLENILCITADRFPVGALYEQAYNLISDGGAACLVSRRPEGFRILATHHLTNGALAQASDDQTVGSFFTYVHRVVSETLAKAELDMADIRWVVPQNTNRKAWPILASLLGVADDQAFFESMPECGHVISADNVINLALLESRGALSTGDRVVTFMAGFGSNWQCLLLERI
ncbi:MAG: hypothetical protein O7G84_06310 [Gammaproteobacteria bacterium]|nr:hypothetical protein [Gammaproteobacteria bacterium]